MSFRPHDFSSVLLGNRSTDEKIKLLVQILSSFEATVRAAIDGGTSIIDPRTADPADLKNGQIWHRSDINEIRVRVNATTYKIDLTAA